MKTAISPARLPKTEPSANSIDFVDEDLALVPVSGIPEEFRKLSRFLPVIVLVPKSAVHDKTTQKKPGSNKSVTGLIDTSDVCSPLDAAKAWLRNPNATDTFEFGGVKGCFSTMEIHRNGRPVILTRKEFRLCSSNCGWKQPLSVSESSGLSLRHDGFRAVLAVKGSLTPRQNAARP